MTAKYMYYVCGGMIYKVFTKLYESMVQSIILYGSSLWGLTDHRHINNLQNRAGQVFLRVNKYTSNIAVHCDLVRLSCLAKQRISSTEVY